MDQNFIKLQKASDLYQDCKYSEALLLVNDVLKINKKNLLACNLKASILIESWNGEESTISQMKEAISHLNNLIEWDIKNCVTYYYNIGNAYNRIAQTRLSRNKVLDQDIIDNLEMAKDYYQKSLNIYESQPQVWINKGNILDLLGRYLEAIECYNKAILIDNTHYNAWVNRGLATRYLASQVTNQDDKKLLYHHSMIDLAIELFLYPKVQIDEKLKKTVNEYITINKIDISKKDFIKEHLPRAVSVLGEDFNLYKTNNVPFETFYLTFCIDHQLFLNTHFDCKNCSLSSKDLLQIGFVIGIKDNKKPYELMNRWLTLLDDYKNARFLLSLSQYRHKDFAFLDKQRYLPDYSLTYIHNIELLKDAFLIVMGIFDKIAFFLNDYEELNMSDSSIFFWGSDSIFNHKPIVKSNGYEQNIVAIDSIRRDLTKNELKKLVEIRNYIVHRYFILHDIVDVDNLTYPYDLKNTPIENKMYHMDVNEFFNLTLQAFKIIRNILFSLSFFIMEKENKKKQDNNGAIPSINWTIDFDENPELKEIADNLANELKKAREQLIKDILKVYDTELKDRKYN